MKDDQPNRPITESAPALAPVPQSALDQLAQSQALLAEGRLAEAESVARFLLHGWSAWPKPYQLLALIAWRQQRPTDAIAWAQRAIALDAANPEYHSNLAFLLSAMGRNAEAQAAATEAVQLDPSSAGAWNNLATACFGLGQIDAAIDALKKAIGLAPERAAFHVDLANVLKVAKRPAEAEASYRRALAIQPAMPEVHSNLGLVLSHQKKWAEAEAAYRQALMLRPDLPSAHANLGLLLVQTGRSDEAEAAYRTALCLQQHPMIAFNLGQLLFRQERLVEAAAKFELAFSLCDDDSDRRAIEPMLAITLIAIRQWAKAETHARTMLQRNAADAAAHDLLGGILLGQGRVDEAMHELREAIGLDPSLTSAHQALLYCRHCVPGVTARSLFSYHLEWNARHAQSLTRGKRSAANFTPDRVLRVGFVSSDFRNHPVGIFLIGLLESIDRTRIETFCYAGHGMRDDLSRRIQTSATSWTRTSGMSDDVLAQKIESDGIDILFDLAGHTHGDRLLAFARRPAPIQITWAGYVGTTGLAAMDYLLADRWHVPSGEEPFYRERVLRMPDGYVCYDPPANAPAAAALPALSVGHITFGSCNNLTKTNASVIAAWSTILRRVPGSRMLMKTQGLDAQAVRERLLGQFLSHGISCDRIELSPGGSQSDILEAYGRIDLALDTFPYSGGLTTLEALWMGVPTVTFPGASFASRHSFAHQSNAGVTEPIATDSDAYIEKAASLASDLAALASLRAELRDRVRQSPVCDAPRFARNFEQLLRDVWRSAL